MLMPVAALVLAVTVVEPGSGLELPIPTEFGCVYLPSMIGTNCPEVSQETIDGFRQNGFWLYATDTTRGAVLSGRVSPARPAFMSEKELNQFVGGVAKGMAKRGKYVPIALGQNNFELSTRNSIRLIRFTLRADVPTEKANPLAAFVEMAVIPTQTHLNVLMESRPERDGLLTGVLDGLEGPEHFQGYVQHFGASPAHWLGTVLGVLLCLGMPALLMLGVLALYLRRKARAAAT